MSAPSDRARDAAQALAGLGIGVETEWTPGDVALPKHPDDPTAPPEQTPVPDRIEGSDVGARASTPPTASDTTPPTLDALIAAIKADPLGHLDPDVIAGALTLTPRDLETLVEILRANDRSLRPFNAALAQARKSQRAAKKASVGAANTRTPSDSRPQIIICELELQVANEAIAALSADTTVFQRARRLVRVAVDGNRDVPPAIEQLPENSLRERLSACVDWRREVFDEETGRKLIPEHPPTWAVKAIHDRGQWAGIRNLTAVTVCPLMRPNGTVLCNEGYDSDTGYLFVPLPDVNYPPVPEEPTDAEVQQALDTLMEPIADFEFDTLGPFDDPALAHKIPKGVTPAEQNRRLNQASCLAFIFTLLCRPAIKGPCPLTVFNACTPGTGKSLLCHVAVLIGTGLEMVVSTWNEDQDESRKAILGHLLAGEKCVVFDNVNGLLGHAVLDAVITAWPQFSGRELGKNNSPKVPSLTAWAATGNNLRIHDDTIRRTLRCSMRSTYDDPSDRDPSSFKHEKLLRWAKENRARLVTAALTILRGWWVASKRGDADAQHKLRPWPSFEEWAGIVPQVLAWLGFPDIGLGQAQLQKGNEATTALGRVIVEWKALCLREGALADAAAGRIVGMGGPIPTTPARLLLLLKDLSRSEEVAELKLALEELAGGKTLDRMIPAVLGKLLGRYRGRAVKGEALFSEHSDKGTVWEVRRVRPEAAENTGTPAQPAVTPSEDAVPPEFSSREADSGDE